jgi:hypothetical protein
MTTISTKAMEIVDAWCVRYANGTPPVTARDKLVTDILALATPSTGAVGEPVAWRYRSGFRKGVWLLTSNDTLAYAETAQGNEVEPLYAAPPSSPSERDAALEEAAKVADQFARATAEDAAQDYMLGMRSGARRIADKVRALKASRSDTVGPEAGE